MILEPDGFRKKEGVKNSEQWIRQGAAGLAVAEPGFGTVPPKTLQGSRNDECNGRIPDWIREGGVRYNGTAPPHVLDLAEMRLNRFPCAGPRDDHC